MKPADIVLTNARVYTVDQSRPWAQVVAVDGESIVYVGTQKDPTWERFIGPGTSVSDMHGRLVLPGMIDSHTHPRLVAMSSWRVTLPWTYDKTELFAWLGQYAAAHSRDEAPFIWANYYPTAMFGDEGPHKEDLDAYVSDRPVLIVEFTGHSCLVNSKMLELMGVDKNTPDPEPGVAVFVRDAEGNATGWVKEGAWRYFAGRMYAALNWSPAQEVAPELLNGFLEFLSSRGVCALFDAGGSDGFMGSEDTYRALAELDRRGELHMYCEGSNRFLGVDDLSAKIAELRNWQTKYGSRHISLRTMKFFLDGMTETGTGAVLEPHSNDPGGTDYGPLYMSKDDLVACMLALNEENLDLHIHVTGDRAFRTACNAVEKAQQQLGDAWRVQVTLAHCMLVDPTDMPRVARLGIIVNWSPHWSGGYFGTESVEWLGQDRFDRMYQFNPIISTGGIVALSSDVASQYEAPRADPFLGLQVGHTRIDPWWPMGVREPASGCLALSDLVKGYTLNGAIQLRRADTMGSIEVGKLANMVVLNKDLFSLPGDQIPSAEPEAVLFEGRLVHGTLLLS